jgi:hypothetical protein
MTVTEHQLPSSTCTCNGDPDLHMLRDLIAAGYGQQEASVALWDPTVVNRVSVALAGREARRIVRDGLAARLPWLRLPPRGDLTWMS